MKFFKNKKNIALLGFFVLALFIFNYSEDTEQQDVFKNLDNPEIISYSDLIFFSNDKSLNEIYIDGQKLIGQYNNGDFFTTNIPFDSDIYTKLGENGANVVIANRLDRGPGFIDLLLFFSPILLVIGFLFFMIRGIKGSGGPLGAIGKSKAKLLKADDHIVTFKDVAGVEEAKNDLEEIVDFLKDPKKFSALGGRIPKGVLLSGSPGTGKTLLARAVAGEANVPFFSISGSDFVEMFVGVGASRVRDMFKKAKENAPCIIFIDEIDAVGRHRGAGVGGGNDEREQTLNQILVGMDGFEENEGVILIAATNRPDVLDSALIRPGRFDRHVNVSLPNLMGRVHILGVHLKKCKVDKNLNLMTIARGTPGFSGADLSNLVNEAALKAARKNLKEISLKDLEEARDKIIMGTEQKTMIMSDEEKKITAFHEAGHTLIALKTKGNDPLHKVSIIPRGRALGVTVSLPDREKYGYRKSEIIERLQMLFGGRVAERIIFGDDEITTGAGDDLRRATDLARRMVTEWGMSDALGHLYCVSDNKESTFKVFSETTSTMIDMEIMDILDCAENKTENILKNNIDDLKLLANALLEYETLDVHQIKHLLKERDFSNLPSKISLESELSN